MSTAVVTGARSGIGKAITHRLLEMGYEIIAISRTIDETTFSDPRITPLPCDLSDTKAVDVILSNLSADNSISLLINAAGFGRFEPHETLSSSTINNMINVNLNAPIQLTNILLRTLKQNQGAIINITSIEAVRSSKFAALYAATKSGLRAFGESLFEEVRKSGVMVVTINPDMTDTPFFNDLHFGVGSDMDTHLLAEDIADGVENVLSMRHGAVITEMTLRAQRFGITKKQKKPQ